jgi:hypothetical protein
MKTNPRKTPGIRGLGPVDISAIRDDILAIPPSVWARENAAKPNKFEALDTTQHIVFRFITSPLSPEGSIDYPIWSEWRDRLEPVLAQSTRSYGYLRGAYPRVMLAKMDPGGIIHPHVDANPAAGWPHKIHVPIQTNPGVEFFIAPNTYHMREGEAYEVNNRGLHAVKNLGATARIHLIFEYYDLDQPLESLVG